MIDDIYLFQNKFKVITGYSDHTFDNFSAFASGALGSKVIEKHITLNKKFKGPDHPFAIEPHEMKNLIYGIRKIEDLPDHAKNYIYAVEDFIETKISSISTSPEREDTILIENPFEI